MNSPAAINCALFLPTTSLAASVTVATYTQQKSYAKKNQRHLQFAVPRLLEENGYCREGYYTLDTLISYGNGSLRGECKEAATAEDRERFGKKQPTQ